MSRYVRANGQRPAANWFDDDSPLVPCITVDDAPAIDTGLFWHDGSPIMRVNDPIGFGRENER